MKKRTPKWDDAPRPSESFKRFQETVRRLLTVSKKELDELRAAEQSKKRKAKKRIEGQATSLSPP